MARTTSNTVDYFPHDSNASSGDTLTILQSRYGNNGYAFWFKLLEKLSSTEGHYIDCRNPVKWQVFIAKMGVDEITTVEMLNLLVEMQAIDKELWDSKLIWCQKLVDNFSVIYKNRRRDLPQKPIITDNNPITTVEKGLTSVEIPQSKVKESKVNNTIVNNNSCSSNDFPSENINDEVTSITQELFDLYENNIGLITPIIQEEIRAALKIFPPEKIEFAINEATKKNHRSWSYIAGVLNNQGSGSGKSPQNKSSPPDDASKYTSGEFGRHVQH